MIEAMSLGKPVIATNIPESGVPWVNAHKVSGINVAPQDPAAIAKAVVDICESEDEYKQFASGALNRYNTEFTRKKMIESLINFYKKIIA